MRKAITGAILTTMIMLLITLLLYPHLPDQIPLHWNLDGVDAYGNRMYIFCYPLLLGIVNCVLIIASRMDPKRKNYQRFTNTYIQIFRLLNISTALLLLVMIYAAWHPDQVNIGMFTQLFIGILITFFGNLMPRIKQNFIIGFKTPWALSDERVWTKTHRFAGRIWFYAGILITLTSFLPLPGLVFNIGMLLVVVGTPFIYSYTVYRKLNIKGEHI